MKTLLAILATALVTVPASAQTLSGLATVVDGDTLRLEGRRVRLLGIDAPEARQTCELAGERWACGEESTNHLRQLVGAAQVECSGSEVDVYNRLLAICSAGSVELNRAMVAQGWATAFRRYSEAYVADETRARASKLGLWASNFVPPEEYRAERRQIVATPWQESELRAHSAQSSIRSAPVTACGIKGNRNRRGQWIYHLPGTRYYAQTRAEEMFCTETEAQAAGYRKSRAG
ncbi:thermonuclease family protein [Altericroceibacterium xinjiangense]|uniref:thermonuclease family protein n=1 Tax=Altericroceibacterium xinjiangense TaxID=762261 RepID=UPI000F7EE8A2|nr:thermonuclease family protein [Altericroceibacterium xinjiangense]